MKKIILSLILLIWSSYLMAQSNWIKVNFSVDNEQVKLNDNFKVVLIFKGDSIRASTKGDSFLIPREIDDTKKLDLIFTTSEYILDFNSIKINSDLQDQSWDIGVDRKPFDKEKIKLINKHRSKTYLIYFLNDGNGSLITIGKWK